MHEKVCVDLDANGGGTNKQEMDRDSTSPCINQNLDGADKIESNATALSDIGKDLEAVQVSAPGTSDLQQSGDVTSGWQIVLHEESNQYYYWNTQTGETSWEIPEVLAQASGSADTHKTAVGGERTENALVDIQDPNLTSALTFEGLSAATQTHPVEWSGLVKNEIQNYTNLGNDVINSSSINATLGDGSSMSAICDKFVQDMISTEDHEPGMDLSSSLIKYSESLIERLKSVKG